MRERFYGYFEKITCETMTAPTTSLPLALHPLYNSLMGFEMNRNCTNKLQEWYESKENSTKLAKKFKLFQAWFKFNPQNTNICEFTIGRMVPNQQRSLIVSSLTQVLPPEY